MTERSEQEGFGEADLDEAQADDAAVDPEMVDEDEPSQEELTDVPALAPADNPPAGDAAELAEEEQAAADAAGAIGGETGEPELPEAERPVAEAGGGEAEGFEQAEEELIESASHGDPAGHPLGDRFTEEESDPDATYGEADDVRASEVEDDPGEPA